VNVPWQVQASNTVKRLRVRLLSSPRLLVTLYFFSYALAWIPVLWAHRTDPGDGLEYMFVGVLTVPWVALNIVINIASEVLKVYLANWQLDAILHVYAAVNAIIIYRWSRRRANRLAANTTPQPGRV
jgi:hypothetical protein